MTKPLNINEPTLWSKLELILLIDIFLRRNYKDERVISKAFQYNEGLNSYLSRSHPVFFKSKNDIKTLFKKFENWHTSQSVNDCNSYEFFYFQDLIKQASSLTTVAGALRIFIESQMVLYDFESSPMSLVEGESLEKKHFIRERDLRVVAAKKASVLKEKKYLACEVCDFNFEDHYGVHGANYAEVHHLKPISEFQSRSVTHLEDLAIVCSNCHRMIHRKKPWLSITELKNMIRMTSSKIA